MVGFALFLYPKISADAMVVKGNIAQNIYNKVL